MGLFPSEFFNKNKFWLKFDERRKDKEMKGAWLGRIPYISVFLLPSRVFGLLVAIFWRPISLEPVGFLCFVSINRTFLRYGDFFFAMEIFKCEMRKFNGFVQPAGPTLNKAIKVDPLLWAQVSFYLLIYFIFLGKRLLYFFRMKVVRTRISDLDDVRHPGKCKEKI